MSELSSNQNFTANNLGLDESPAIDEKATHFEINLQKHTKELKECQAEHKLSSCLPCEQLLKCKKRNDYVKAAFDKMCQGEDRGFIF